MDSWLDVILAREAQQTMSDPRVTVFIVDYDLRANNSRRSFYRHVKAWLKHHNREKDPNWSTQSVVITTDLEFAEFVYEEASHLGHAHLYKAEQIK